VTRGSTGKRHTATGVQQALARSVPGVLKRQKPDQKTRRALESPALQHPAEEATVAVGVVLEFKSGTLEQYDQVVELMGLKAGRPLADGGIFHWVTETDDGVRVTDVWESREQFEAFAKAQIGPYSAQVGMPEPQITFHDVHNYMWKV
jgi:hypothetical protein